MLTQQTLPGLPALLYADPSTIKAQSVLRRVCWLREELSRPELGEVPNLRAAYERELALLEADPRLRMRVLR